MTADARYSPARFGIALLALWLLACAIVITVAWPRIVTLTMWDPDDYLRLQQIRDLLGGQHVFDLHQYRIDPPDGIPMHWSRIVDAPIVALILTLKPLVGPVLAERAAVIVAPLLILGGSLGALALIGARLAGRRTGLITAMLAATAPAILFQVMPMRIDHHGWQTMLALFAIAACLDPRPARGGTVAGMAAATWLSISLEGLPMTVAIGAVLALRFVIEDERRQTALRFRRFAAALSLTSLALFLCLHSPQDWFAGHCDAVSPPWIGPLLVTPALLAIFARPAARRGAAMRLGLVGLAGLLGAGLLIGTAPDCLRGPFGTLDPVVRQYWYENVLEGMPVWRQSPIGQVMTIAFPLVGLAGTLFGCRQAASAEKARGWLVMLALLLAAFALALLVNRATALAYGCALPGAAALVSTLLDRIGRSPHMLNRIAGSALVIGLLSPAGAVIVGNLTLTATSGRASLERPQQPCSASADCFSALAKLPRAHILAGLDMTPELLIHTQHSYAGSGYHRDPAAIRRVIDAFINGPDHAHRIMRAHGMRYLLIDPNGKEAEIYRKDAPAGLMADLLAGRAPAWLQPVPLPGSSFRMWRRIS